MIFEKITHIRAFFNGLYLTLHFRKQINKLLNSFKNKLIKKFLNRLAENIKNILFNILMIKENQYDVAITKWFTIYYINQLHQFNIAICEFYMTPCNETVTKISEKTELQKPLLSYLHLKWIIDIFNDPTFIFGE